MNCGRGTLLPYHHLAPGPLPCLSLGVVAFWFINAPIQDSALWTRCPMNLSDCATGKLWSSVQDSPIAMFSAVCLEGDLVFVSPYPDSLPYRGGGSMLPVLLHEWFLR